MVESVLALEREVHWFSTGLCGSVVWVPHKGRVRVPAELQVLPWDEHPNAISTQELLPCLEHLPSPKTLGMGITDNSLSSQQLV